MRQGQNPAKLGLHAYQPKKLGMAVLAYIPSQEGYFAQSLDILKLQIASIHRSTEDFDLLVFDNGSCVQVQEELQQMQAKGLISFLILSKHNIGKTGALNWILASMPNELIGYADGDVFFRPGWLGKSIEIFQAFPQAGLVTAQPCLFDILKGSGRAHLTLNDETRYQLSDGLPDAEVVNEYGKGIGLSNKKIDVLLRTPVQLVEDKQSGVSAVIGASHMQFLMRREVARQIVPLPAVYALERDEDVVLNQRIDDAGLCHFSTLKPHVYHMGNRLDQEVLNEAISLGLDEILQHPAKADSSNHNQVKRQAFRFVSWLSRWSVLRNLIRRSYNFLFEYHAQTK